ncbi:MAG: hypothetical protein CV088_02380 [Nitrospira sp. LK70]|nr:hypothetical protein [Nitrospira sp. LK70]
MSKPDEQVADRIIEQLRKQKLLSESALRKLKPQLVAGKLSAEDWKLAIELDLTDKAKATDEDH